MALCVPRSRRSLRIVAPLRPAARWCPRRYSPGQIPDTVRCWSPPVLSRRLVFGLCSLCWCLRAFVAAAVCVCNFAKSSIVAQCANCAKSLYSEMSPLPTRRRFMLPRPRPPPGAALFRLCAWLGRGAPCGSLPAAACRSFSLVCAASLVAASRPAPPGKPAAALFPACLLRAPTPPPAAPVKPFSDRS